MKFLGWSYVLIISGTFFEEIINSILFIALNFTTRSYDLDTWNKRLKKFEEELKIKQNYSLDNL
ncbi:hypothetical protein H5410_030322 [Solanum commersonii]|uniref:Uncharacterized protein n=1 Tax=Solanum commersonii TaxID=4109 RepID=A0A9J5YH42_SOLCO|nr:hypothetical protein H5410_030322 [Solanum commersonii]